MYVLAQTSIKIKIVSELSPPREDLISRRSRLELWPSVIEYVYDKKALNTRLTISNSIYGRLG